MKTNATSNAANPKNIGKRNRNGVRPPVRVEHLKGGGLTHEVLRLRITHEGQRSPAPPTGGSGAPNPTPKSELSGEKRPGPSTPSAGGADKSSENGRKRRLNWHSKCLQAAGVEVKFPEVE